MFEAPLTNESRKLTDTVSSFDVVDDATLASTDLYAMVGIELNGLPATMKTINQSIGGSKDGVFIFSEQMDVFTTSATYGIPETTATATITHDGTPDGTTLRIRITGTLPSGETLGQFITDNAGSGITHFTDSRGVDWPVFDVDASTEPGGLVGVSSNELVVNFTNFLPGDSDIYVIHPSEQVAFQLRNTSSISDQVYIDPSDAEASRLNGNLPGSSNQTITQVSSSNYNALGLSFMLPLYIDPTAAPEDRLQHSGAGGSAPFDILISGIISTNKLLEAKYNPNAATDGFRLRVKSSAFAYNNTDTGTQTDSKIFTSFGFRGFDVFNGSV